MDFKEKIVNWNQRFQEKKSIYEKLKNKSFEKKGEITVYEENLAKNKEKLVKITAEMSDLELVENLLKKTLEIGRQTAIEKLAEMVNIILRKVFGPDFLFKIKDEDNKIEFYVQSNNLAIKGDPTFVHGGGIIDILAIALRITILSVFFNTEESSDLLILDEPAKHVSEDYIMAVGDLLIMLAKELKKQLIIITHNKYLSEIASTAYQVRLINDTSQVIKIIN